MDKPRILFVTKYHLYTATGGTEEQGWLLSTELARRGWDVHYASELEHPFDPAVREGVTHHALSTTSSVYSSNRRELCDLMHRLRPDIVYNRVYNLYTRNTMLDAPPGTLRVWATAAEGDGQLLRKIMMFRRSAGIARFIKRFPLYWYIFKGAQQGARTADIVIAQRQEIYDCLRSAGYDCVLIRNTQQSVPESDVQKHTGQPIVLWAGSIKDWKQPMQFIELARRCGDLDAVFLMIGRVLEAKYHAILESAVKEIPNFRYGGQIPLAEVGDYYKQAHLFVSTSLSEGYPTTFVQAWQRGVPVVSMNKVNPEKLLTEAGLGYLADSLEEMESALRDLLNNPDRRREIGHKARGFAQEEYELTRTVDKLEQLFAQKGVRLPAR